LLLFGGFLAVNDDEDSDEVLYVRMILNAQIVEKEMKME